MNLNVTVTGQEELAAKLDRLAVGLKNFERAFTTIGDELVHYYSTAGFSDEGSEYGTPWAQLSPSTQAYKDRHYSAYASMPLVATGKMRNSFNKRVSPTELVILNTAPYFKYHQSSGSHNKVPRRQVMGIDGDVKIIIRSKISADIKSKMGII